MKPDSKIVLPSSDAEDYFGNILRSTISRIVNPTCKLLIPSHTRYRTNNSLGYLQVRRVLKAAEKSTVMRNVQVGGQKMWRFLL